MNDSIRRWATALPAVFLMISAARADSTEDDVSSGEWRISVAGSGGSDGTSLLCLPKARDDKAEGYWIDAWGVQALKDLTLEGRQIRFTHERTDGQGTSGRWKFEGEVSRGKLTGTLSRDTERIAVKGRRIRSEPALVGNYAFGYTRDRVNSMLSIREDRSGKLTAQWKHDGGVVSIEDFTHEKNKVTFTFDGNGFVGSLKGQGSRLSGKFDTARGKIQVDAFRMGTDLIGVWDIDVKNERGAQKQRLKVLPDMSGYYGALRVEKIHLENDNPTRRGTGPRRVTFEAKWKVGEQTHELRFEGRLTDAKELNGVLVTSRGSAKIVGKKRVRSTGR